MDFAGTGSVTRIRSNCIAGQGAAAIAFLLIAATLGGCPQPPDPVDVGDLVTPSQTNPDSGRDAGSGGGQRGGDQTPAPTPPTPGPDDVTPPTPVPVPAPSPVPGGALTIAALGDSYTEGSGDQSPAGGGFPTRVLTSVENRRPGSTVLNVGHSGWTSTDLIRGLDGTPSELEEAVAARPNIATVWIGSNDMWQLYADGFAEVATSEMEAATLATFTTNIDTILTRLKATGATLYIGTLDDQSKRPAAGTALYGITPEELTLMSAQVARFNSVITAAAQRHGVTVVDFSQATFLTDPALLDADGIHPNAAGYDRIAAIWLAAMAPSLE